MCQFACLTSIDQVKSYISDLTQAVRKNLSLSKRKLNYVKESLCLLPQKQNISQDSEKPTINVGDMVRILSREKIQSMLDYRGFYKNCPFIEEMYNHCGKEYRVLREANYFYDEVKEKMCKCKNIVVLEGTICSGRQKLYKEMCDMQCYFFWHNDWLVKI